MDTPGPGKLGARSRPRPSNADLVKRGPSVRVWGAFASLRDFAPCFVSLWETAVLSQKQQLPVNTHLRGGTMTNMHRFSKGNFSKRQHRFQCHMSLGD